MERQKDFSGFLSATIDLLLKNAAAVLIYVAFIGGIGAVGLIFGYLQASENIAGFNFGFSIDTTTDIAQGLYQLGIVVVSFVAAYFFLSHVLANEGRLHGSGTRIWANVGLVFLSSIGLIFGFILLIVPGIILAVRWSAASGFLIGERSGVVDSLKESWEATEGYSWPIFFTGLVLFFGLFIVAAIFGGAAGFAGTPVVVSIVSSLLDAFGNTIVYTFGIAIFLLLHDDSEEVGEMFS